MIDKSCYTCKSASLSKDKFPCDKCHNQNNWHYKFDVQLLCLFGVGLIVAGFILL